MTPSSIAFLSALMCSVIVAPIVGIAARRLGVVDFPDGQRKLHKRVVPLTGGPTVLVSLFVGLGATLWVYPTLLQPTYGDIQFLMPLGLAGSWIVVLGILDDRIGLRGRQKLFGQLIAALIMIPSGIAIRKIQVFGIPIEFGDFSSIVTVFWILGAINALNLIDGVDGLASTIGIVLSLSVAAVTVVYGGRVDGLIISLALAGSLVGFLFFNFPPARMFLGDSGSMLIGLVVGCVALKCSLKQYTAMALVMPTAIWAIPIFDVAMAIVRRRLTGRSIYSTDRGHLHHCLVRQGHSGSSLLVIVGSLCGLTGLGAIAAAWFGNEMIAVLGVATALAILVATRSFGAAELTLLTNRVRRFAGSLVRRPVGSNPVLHDEQVQLHGKQEWHQLWHTLTEFADRFEMDAVELLVNIPSVGEEYHASWRSTSKVELHEAWRSEIPLIIDGMRVGHIRVVGVCGNGSICEWMSDLIGGLRPFETHLIELINELHGNNVRPEAPSLSDSGTLQLSQ
jgi:UDP-GlcNAc:undecaprenyl-phosphate GlcNAc-1-phosphate transferase